MAKDLTGQKFGTLIVLRQADKPYIAPSGQKSSRWVCYCEACGRETTMAYTALYRAKSCGCLRLSSLKHSPKNQKNCVVCGKQFYAPPTGNKTCSPDCQEKWRSLRQTGSKHPWSAEALAARAKDMAAKELARSVQPLAVAAHMAQPENQRGEENRFAKCWVLVDGSGNYHYVINLLHWARENYALFEPYAADPEKAAKRIASGIMTIASSMRGVPCRKARPSMTYKGWRLADLPRPKKTTPKR